MSENLFKIAKVFNVATTTIIDFLTSKGYSIENKPNAKLSEEMMEQLNKEYKGSADIKKNADQMQIGTSYKKPEEKIGIPKLLVKPIIENTEKELVGSVELESLSAQPNEGLIESPQPINKEEKISAKADSPKLEVLEKIDTEKFNPEPKKQKLTGLKILGKIDTGNYEHKVKKHIEIINKVKANKQKVLNLGNCELKEWPPEIFTMVWLETIILRDNTKWDYVKSIFVDSEEKSFDNKNYISNIPQEIKKLKSLKNLSIGGDERTRYPIKSLEGLRNKKTIEKLDLAYCEFTTFKDFDTLQNINYLNLSGNLLFTIDKIFNLKNLNQLYLNNNKITSIQDEEKFRDLIENISEINLKNNDFEEEWLDQETLEIIGDDVYQIIDRIQSSLSGLLRKSNSLPLKLILIGNSRVGKTTLAKVLLGSSGNLIEEGSTHGLVIRPWNMGPSYKHFEVFIYDFGGQDYYHSVYNMFLTWQTIYILVWDYSENINFLNSNEDYNNLHSNDQFMKFSPHYWLGNIKYWLTKKELARQTELGNDRIKIISLQNIIGNVSENILNINPNPCNHHFSINLHELDKKTNELKIEILKQNIINIAHEFDKNTLLSENDNDVMQKVLYNFNEVTYSPLLLQDFYSQYGKPDNPTFFFELLNSKGIVLFRHDDEILKNIIWVNPSKVSEKIYSILSKKETLNKGEVEKQKFEDSVEDPNLLRLMILQEVIYLDVDSLNKSKSKYVIPQFLPYNDSNDSLFELASLGIEDSFYLKFKDYLPHGLMTRLICRLGKYPDKKYYYRNCILFMMRDEGVAIKVLISLNIEQLEFSVKFVMENGNQSFKSKIANYLFKCILAAYWNEPHIELNVDSNNIDIDNKDAFTNKIWGDEYLYKFTNIQMDISLDAEYYVDYRKTFFDESDPEYNKLMPYEIMAYYHDLVIINGEVKFQRKEKLIPTSDFNSFIYNKVKPIKKLFISYAHSDIEYKKTLDKYLVNLIRNRTIQIWYDDKIEPGDFWDDKIKTNLLESDIVIMLVSQNYIASTYIYENEMPMAIQNLNDNNCKIIPFVIESCDWENWKILPKGSIPNVFDQVTLGDIQALPAMSNRQFLPLNKWEGKEDEAWLSLIKAIREVCEK